MSSNLDVLGQFANVWEGLAPSLPDDYGCTLTCSEAEALALVFRVANKPDVAHEIIERHAETDEPGDDHYKGD